LQLVLLGVAIKKLEIINYRTVIIVNQNKCIPLERYMSPNVIVIYLDTFFLDLFQLTLNTETPNFSLLSPFTI
jgi:hypothetical protein